jgi:hypothetical protein
VPLAATSHSVFPSDDLAIAARMVTQPVPDRTQGQGSINPSHLLPNITDVIFGLGNDRPSPRAPEFREDQGV